MCNPPWIEYPGFLPSDIFWRQEGEVWALGVWLPFWVSLNDIERQAYLKEWDAPLKWQEFYNPAFQKELSSLDGPGGWILRNNLAPCDDNLPRYISVTKKPPSFLSTLKRYAFLIFGIRR
ncbi:MAG: hypothetical protein Q8S31_07725 [Alphaproteobacteria bacterium]|nr:hypothetical protein [Alphaproteobacteria bacterium]